MFLNFLQGVVPFLGVVIDESKPPCFFGVRNGLLPNASSLLSASPFPNVLELPMVLLLSLLRLLIN